MKTISTKDEVPLRLSWHVTRLIAVLAYLNNISFDEMIERAMREGLN
jgi:uncharacterized protein YktA (UPF0223 family)